jgi:hypothetical protein
MPKGHISFEDAQMVHDFAIHVQPILRHENSLSLLKTAETVQRIAYCAIADARQLARAERARHGYFPDYTTEIFE